MSSSLQLPPPLLPWAPWLDLLPLESALGLGPLLRRLDGLIGPLRASPRSGSVEPDGFDGLARRGLPERLLLSEWLLADEEPLEFLRRLSQNESAFLQLARRDPFAARSSLALFDCGPDVLGGPRLVCLAAMLVLARRAQSAGATFRWGAWQRPGEWQSEVNRESVEWWLSLRGEGEPGEEHRAKWEELWREEKADFSSDELWLVGSPVLAALKPERARVLELSDELDPFALDRAVVAELEGRTLRLVLPEEAVGARLIRDPFAHIAPKSGEKNSFDVEPLDQGLVWAQSGWKLFARTQEGNLLVFSVPNSPSATVGAPKKLAVNGVLVAVGRVGRATVAATLAQREGVAGLQFQSWGRGSTEWNGGYFSFQQESYENEQQRLEKGNLGSVIGVGNAEALSVLLSSRRFGVAVHGEQVLRDEETNGAVAAIAEGHSVAVLHCTYKSVRFSSLSVRVSLPVWQHDDNPIWDAGAAFAGWGGQPNNPIWMIKLEGPKWLLLKHGQRTEFFIESKWDVLGCLCDQNGRPGLVMGRLGERDLFFRPDASHEEPLCHFTSPIRSVAVCGFAPLIALQGDRELGVYSLNHNLWLLKARWD